MTDIISAIGADIREYEELCAAYCEPIQMLEDGYPDCYGEHAKELKDRRRAALNMLQGER